MAAPISLTFFNGVTPVVDLSFGEDAMLDSGDQLPICVGRTVVQYKCELAPYMPEDVQREL
ncbi:hypothetical protein D3C85_1695710 [compost metagenome]